jgi:hypothetical protein
MVYLLFGGSELFCGHFSTDFLPLPVFRGILRQTLLRRSLDMAIESQRKSPNHPAGIDQRDFSFSEKPHIQIHCLLNISHYRAIINLEKYTF